MPLHFSARRREALDAISESCGMRVDVGDEWQVLAICDGESVVGGVMRMGREIHVGLIRPIFIRGLIRGFVKPGDTTRCRESNTKGRRFVERLGFELNCVEGGIAHYTLREVKHA